MNIKKFNIILHFFLKPRFTILKSDPTDYSFLLAGLVLLAGCFSIEISGLIADSAFKSFADITTSSVSNAALITLELLLGQSLLAFAAALPTRKIQAGKLFFFSLLSFAPALLYTPAVLLCSALGNLSDIASTATSFAITLYIIYLLFTTIKTTMEITTSRVILLLIYPPVLLILLLLVIFVKLSAL